jgi:hypothetical protein
MSYRDLIRVGIISNSTAAASTAAELTFCLWVILQKMITGRGGTNCF